MPDAADSLTPKQEEAIVALLAEPSVRKAAEAVEVDERTVHRWLGEPAFKAALRKARREHFAQATALAQRYAATALGVLVQIAADKGATTSARVSAAAHVLKFGRESLEMDDLAARVEDLERADALRRRGDP